jgi:phage tail protein X
MSNIIAVAHDDEPLDALVWRSVGASAAGVEQVLEANPGLAELGPFLPAGTRVTIPAQALVTTQSELIQLWT